MDTPCPAYRGDAAYTFVCYAHADSAAVYPLLGLLHDAGIRLWYDEGIPPGDSWRAEISQRLDRADAMLLFVSRALLASEHCRRELDFALDNGTRLIPVLLEDVELTPELRMGLGRVQMIRRSGQGEAAFQERLTAALEQRAPEEVAASPSTNRRAALWVAAVMAMAAILAAGAWFTRGTSPEQPAQAPEFAAPAAHPKSIAVLPFANLSNDPEQAFFADGVAEEILNRLARNPELHVISRTSAFSFRDERVDLQSIAAALNVAHVVEGSVRRAGDTLRITAKLVEVQGDRQLWADSYDRELVDVLAVQDEIARGVAERLRVTLLGAAGENRRVVPGAYERYLQARQLLDQFEPDSRPLAKRLLDEAIALDPDFGVTYVQLARYHVHSELQDTISRAEGFERANAALDRGLALEPENVDALGVRAWMTATYARDLHAAGRQFTRALALEPTNISTLKLAIDMALMLGRVSDAVAIGQYVVLRDPLCVLCRQRFAHALSVAGRFQESEAQDRMAARMLNRGSPGVATGYALLYRGEAARALTVFRQIDPTSGYHRYLGELLALHALGRQVEFELALTEARKSADPDGLPNLLASVYANLGDHDEAFAWLERAGPWEDYDLRFWIAPLLSHDSRWQDYLTRINRTPEELATVEFRYTLPDN